MKILERISEMALFLVIIVALFVGAARDAEAEETYYVVIGQSNALGIVEQAGLHEKLSSAEHKAHIINCAHSGKKIELFLPNWDSRTFYGNCLKNIGDKKISAIIFWQGESDTISQTMAARWSARARVVLFSIMTELGYDIPIVMVALNSKSHACCKYWLSIRDAQINMVSQKLTIIDGDNYEYMPDLVHLTHSGYQSVGDDIASALLIGRGG